MAELSIYLIERDNGDGRYVGRYSFEDLAAAVINVDGGGFVTHSDTPGGLVGTLYLPVGWEADVERDAVTGPGGVGMGLDDAMRAARDEDGSHRMGFSFRDV
jgi:hypothetical protein